MGEFVSEKPKRSGERLISYRFAVTVIALLFGASAAGWIATELVPPNFPEKTEFYERAWGATAVKLVTLLRLHDPFHSFWYELVLALFFVVLFVCIATRWRQLALKSWRTDMPSGAEELRSKALSFECSWRLASEEAACKGPLMRAGERYGRTERVSRETLRALFSDLVSLLAKKGYRVTSREGDDEIRFAAFSGRWRSPGAMLFHIGILVITIGGVIGSFTGWREMTLVREGASIPFPRDSMLSLRVDDFAIVTTERLEIKDFISTVSILDAYGDVIASGKVEVNLPMKVDGRRIYQSEFRTGEDEFKSARVGYAMRKGIRNGSIEVVPGAPVPIGDSAIILTAVRFLPDFRMSPEGPFSASAFPSNPALEVEISGPDGAEKGWLFVNHPDFNKRFNAPVDLVLARCDPVYYTGLEVSANPGAPVLFAGFALATIGLMLMYLSNPRALKGFADGKSLVMAGVESRWKASFEKEFGEMRENIRQQMGRRG
jgi:cytochrome c biogenesis protein